MRATDEFDLTRLEELVMMGASYGLSKTEIAETLNVPSVRPVTVETVGRCIANVYHKLQALERSAEQLGLFGG